MAEHGPESVFEAAGSTVGRDSEPISNQLPTVDIPLGDSPGEKGRIGLRTAWGSKDRPGEKKEFGVSPVSQTKEETKKEGDKPEPKVEVKASNSKPESKPDKRSLNLDKRLGGLLEQRDALLARLAPRQSLLAEYGRNEHLHRLDDETDARLDRAQEEVKADRRELAKLTLDIWRQGGSEKLSSEDLTVIAQDLADNLEESALGKLVINRHGFRNAQQALRKLELSEVSVESVKSLLETEYDQINGLNPELATDPTVKTRTITKNGSRVPEYLKDYLKKTTLTAGVGGGVLGAIALAGGPVSWAAFGAGVAGGAIGRGLGEGYRQYQLRKEAENKTTGEKLRFNEKVGRDLFSEILYLQTQAKESLQSEDPNERAQAILELVKKAGQVESRSQQEYRGMEKKAAWVKAGLSIMGAVGGAWLYSHNALGALGKEKEQAIIDAKMKGIRIFHDEHGVAHVTTDTGKGHVVKQAVDKAWHFVAEHKDFSEVNHLASQKGEWVRQFWHHIGQSNVPHQMPSQFTVGQELMHAGTLDVGNITSAINESVVSSSLHALWVGSVGAVAPLVVESAVSDGASRASEARVRADDKALIDSLEEVEARLRQKKLHREQIGEEVPEDEAKRVAYFEQLARKNGVTLPKKPVGFEYDWGAQLHKLNGKDSGLPPLDSLPQWRLRGDFSGRPAAVGVVGVDLANNRVALVQFKSSGENQGTYDCVIERLDKFIENYQEIVGVVSPK